jgi:hypothetical protein
MECKHDEAGHQYQGAGGNQADCHSGLSPNDGISIAMRGAQGRSTIVRKLFREDREPDRRLAVIKIILVAERR